MKPTKSPKAVLDTFKGLSDDDQEFIRQVDKQFQMFGEKVRIRVDNKTTSKNSKRTIDGNLG